MEVILVIVGAAIMVVVGFVLGNKKKGPLEDNTELINGLRAQVTSLMSQRDVQKAHAEHAEQDAAAERERSAQREAELKTSFNKQVEELRHSYDTQIGELKVSHEKQLAQIKETAEKQIETLRQQNNAQIETLKQTNKEQMESQLKLITEKMQTTSEEVLKRRQEELGERNTEQVSKIIDPLKESLKNMQEALNMTKDQQKDALTRLDATIRVNMQKSEELGKSADQLARALTAEVKIQGNFGEMRLQQYLEDLGLKEGEQYDTQQMLKDKYGERVKGKDGKAMIPDFILHFPNNRHVVVDSKMSLTDFERYMSAEDGSTEKSGYLQAHLESVRSQVKLLANKDYTAYLPSGYNKLDFAIMYVPIEGALNLAMLNDKTLWNWAYEQGVLILGPQTMYMNLRVLEMMWTQVRQLENQDKMIAAANTIIERVQTLGERVMTVEKSAQKVLDNVQDLKRSTAGSGQSIITPARQLLKAGASEKRGKKSIDEIVDAFADADDTRFIESDTTVMLDNAAEEAE